MCIISKSETVLVHFQDGKLWKKYYCVDGIMQGEYIEYWENGKMGIYLLNVTL